MGRNGINKKENRSLAPYQFSLESAIGEWIAEQVKRTNSAKTEKAYRKTMRQFREFLQLHGYDLLSDALDIARIASLWVTLLGGPQSAVCIRSTLPRDMCII